MYLVCNEHVVSPLERPEDERMHGVLRHLLVKRQFLHHLADLALIFQQMVLLILIKFTLSVDFSTDVLLDDMELIVAGADDVAVVRVVHADLLYFGSKVSFRC